MISAVVDFKKEPPSSSPSTTTSSSSTSSNSALASTSSPTASTTTSTATHPHLSLLTIDTPLNSSPFPSPSSSFLPPPIPGAHEFAMKPAPVGRKGASSVVNGSSGTGTSTTGGVNGVKDVAADSSSVATPRAFGGMLSPSVNSSSTNDLPSSSPAPTLSNPDHTTTSTSTSTSTSAGKNGAPPSTSALPATSPLTPTPSAITPTAKRVSFPPPSSSPAASSANPTPCTTPITSAFMIAAASAAGDDTLNPSSSRPAPPSPVLSRRTSMARSESRRNSAQIRAEGDSRRGSPRSSRALSSGVGSAVGGAGVAAAVSPSARHRLSRSISAAEVEGEAMFVDAVAESPQTASTSASAEPTIKGPQKSPITIRDFAYPPADVRYAGLGPDVPTPCDPARLARRLRGVARLSDYASPGSPDRDDDDDENGWGSGGFMWGRGRMTFGGSSPSMAREDGVGAADFARNFGDPDDEYEEGDEGYVEGDVDGEEEDLYYAEAYDEVPPGLYRAQFAFEAIDAAEMHLQEGQLIHIVGSGATAPADENGEGDGGTGAGWAVARDRDPPLVLDAGVLEVNKMIGSRTDAGAVWGEMWASAAASTNPNPTERRALVPDSYIVLIRGEGEREADAHARLVRYLEWVERERARQEEEDAAAAGDASPSSSEEGEYEDAQAGDERGQLVQT